MKRLFVFISILLISSVVFANTNLPTTLIKNIEKTRQAMKIPGASVAVIENGKIVWAKGFGLTDLSTKRPVTVKTLFQACSITKTLTAAAVLKLLQQKHIALDEPVNRYLKHWQIPANNYTKKVPVTFRLLLDHTAAISNPYPDGGYGPHDKLPTLLQVYQGECPATNPPLTVTRVPGTKFKYCNGCYAVLQGALQSISGMSYPALMEKEILIPAQMHDSLFDNNLYAEDPTRIALPYNPKLQLYKNAPSRNPIYSTGLLWTNATDLAKYAIAITQALQKSNAVISKKLAWKLITPSHNPTHGLGFFIGDKFGNEKANGKYIFHSGANIGYLTLLIISKDGKQGAAVLINISPNWDAKDYPQFEFIKDTVKMISQYYHWK